MCNKLTYHKAPDSWSILCNRFGESAKTDTNLNFFRNRYRLLEQLDKSDITEKLFSATFTIQRSSREN